MSENEVTRTGMDMISRHRFRLADDGNCAEIDSSGLAEEIDAALTALTAAEARIKMLSEAPMKVGELGRDDLRRRAKAMLERNGWKPGDQFSAHSTVELMIALAIDAVQSPLDQCAYPECGCCHDATCAEALTGASNDG